MFVPLCPPQLCFFFLVCMKRTSILEKNQHHIMFSLDSWLTNLRVEVLKSLMRKQKLDYVSFCLGMSDGNSSCALTLFVQIKFFSWFPIAFIKISVLIILSLANLPSLNNYQLAISFVVSRKMPMFPHRLFSFLLQIKV